MKTYDTDKKLKAAYKLLIAEQISIHTFDHVRELLKDLDPSLDKKLEKASKTAKKLQKVYKKKYLQLSIEHLPEDTKEERERKKALLLLIRYRSKLLSEINRVQSELGFQEGDQNLSSNSIQDWGRVIARAKGPLGLITGVAVVVVIGGAIFTRKTHQGQLDEPMIQVEPPQVIIGVTESLTENQNTRASTQPAYIIEEITVDQAGDGLTCGIHVHEHTTETLATGTHIPAEGAVVTVEIETDGVTETLTGTIDENAWVEFTTESPQLQAHLTIISIDGDITWSSSDQKYWSQSPATTFTRRKRTAPTE